MLKTMAKKQLPPGRNRSPNNNSKTKAKTKNTPKTSAKSSNINRTSITETANGDASSEDSKVSVVPSSSAESENNEVVDSSEAEDDGVEMRSSSDEEEEEEQEQKEEEKKPKIIKRKGKKKVSKSNGNTFPMNRISRIVKSVNPDTKIAQEAVFLINRASEKFLHVFCKEAYACAFLDKRKQIAYKHLSSVVSKRKRFQFVSDFVPEMVKAEDALAQVAEAEKYSGFEISD